MFKLINVNRFLQIYTNFQFDACNMFQKNWDRGNKRLVKLTNTQTDLFGTFHRPTG